MSNAATPISPARFAAAIKDLPFSSLHLKAMEIRNNIAHLDYSNEQLKPFADGTDLSSNGHPDQDCIDAIKENEIVIARMQERIALLKAEVEGRGSSWLEFQSAEELQEGDEALVNGTGESDGDVDMEGQERSEAWRDGTFQTGRIVNGEVRMDGESAIDGATNGTANNSGGRLDDEALRRAMEERIRALANHGDEEEGMHL
ncbi:hypothetical protein BGZ57DRAFT_223094 [Hyaloscypha finlandica]|nr:hypothetical protein F5882DRAFT_407946 [Hyaloscypha sp. PMI_1271]KAH8784042.1 hypothetical protein BGZ57DRAFT_223094 [Hyaloscypha finlandica]